MADIEIVIKDKDGTPKAVIEEYTRLETISRFNDVGSWTLDINGNDDIWDLLYKTRGYIEVFEDGVSKFLGIVKKCEIDDTPAAYVMRFAGFDQNHYLLRRIIYPEPADGLPFDTNGYDEQTDYAEQLIKYYILNNIGASALLPRRENITAAPNLNIGSTLTEQGRFATLLDTCQQLAIKGGGLGFYLSTSLVATVYQPTDKSASVVFSKELGNLTSYKYSHEIAEANALIVGGQGDLTDRVVIEVLDGQSIIDFGRIEKFVDKRSVEDSATLSEEATAELEKEKEKVFLSITPIDTLGCTYGVDYELGDKVKVVLETGIKFTDVVREVKKLYDGTSGSPLTQPAISTPNYQDNNPFSNIFAKLNNIKGKVSNLERSN